MLSRLYVQQFNAKHQPVVFNQAEWSLCVTKTLYEWVERRREPTIWNVLTLLRTTSAAESNSINIWCLFLLKRFPHESDFKHMLRFTFHLFYGLYTLRYTLTGPLNEKKFVEFNCLLKDFIIEALKLPVSYWKFDLFQKTVAPLCIF